MKGGKITITTPRSQDRKKERRKGKEESLNSKGEVRRQGPTTKALRVGENESGGVERKHSIYPPLPRYPHFHQWMPLKVIIETCGDPDRVLEKKT